MKGEIGKIKTAVNTTAETSFLIIFPLHIFAIMQRHYSYRKSKCSLSNIRHLGRYKIQQSNVKVLILNVFILYYQLCFIRNYTQNCSGKLRGRRKF